MVVMVGKVALVFHTLDDLITFISMIAISFAIMKFILAMRYEIRLIGLAFGVVDLFGVIQPTS